MIKKDPEDISTLVLFFKIIIPKFFIHIFMPEDPDAPAPLIRVSILNETHRPDPDTLKLDPTQAEAFYSALTQKLTVIQGPPGTGKTFLGLKIVKVLLENKEHWMNGGKSSPILVICYTNHALDQFLEGIMRYTTKIVRIGAQSKCESMKKFGLREWKMRSRSEVQNRLNRQWLYDIKNVFHLMQK